jgi:hypothetical protein
LKLVFPSIDEWQWRLKNSAGVQPNFALDGYLRMLFFFREVIIQDAAIMMDEYPHPVFHHAIFCSPEFLSYKQCLLHQISVMDNPIHQEIQRVLPELCHQIAVNNEALTANLVDVVNQATTHLSDKITSNKVEVLATLSNMKHALSTTLTSIAQSLDECSPLELPTPVELPTIVQDTSILNHNVGPHQVVETSEEDNMNLNPSNVQMPQFHEVMSSSTTTVTGLLIEWEEGVNGKPSVTQVERIWKNKWRMGTQNQKIFSRRKIIVNLIYSYAQQKSVSVNVAAAIMEQKRIEKKYSLLQLADKWKQFQSTELA